MADKRTQRQQKKREKHRKRRQQRQASRKAMRRDARGGPGQAARWPLGEAWLSQGWHDRGATVHAVLTRTHPSGRTAIVHVECDLARAGVVQAEARIVERPGEVVGLLGALSDPDPMLETAPEQVVAVIEAAAAHGRTTGHTPPRGYEAAARLWADVDAEQAPLEVLVGDEAPGDSKGGSWWSRLFGG